MKTNDLTKQILEYCKLKGHYVVRVNNIPGTKYRANNVTKGVSDLMGCTGREAKINGVTYPVGTALAIEIKNKDTKDKQSDAQKEFEAHYKKRNGIYILATKLEDVAEKI